MRVWPASLLVAAACTVDGGGFIGKTCATSTDCPFGYACTEARGPSVRTCEILPANVGVVPGCQANGPPLFYCGNVASVLTAKCAHECHTNPIPTVPGQSIPDYFRLDQYDVDMSHGMFSDGGYVLGALQMAQRIVVRGVCQRDMPPAGFPGLTDAERQELIDWGSQGALFCDGGVSTDGGGGVSFISQVQPIFGLTAGGTCTTCHLGGGAAPGGMDLSFGVSYSNLVNVPCGTSNQGTIVCDGGSIRVVPFDAGASELWLKITNDPNKCGSSMPKGGNPLSPTDQQTIFNWIKEGAPLN